MDNSTTTCEYGGALHWDNGHGSSTPALIPMDASDMNRTSFQFSTSTCTTSYSYLAATGSPTLSYTYTAGDVLIAFFLYILIFLGFVATVLRTNV